MVVCLEEARRKRSVTDAPAAAFRRSLRARCTSEGTVGAPVIDIGANLTSKSFHRDLPAVIDRAAAAGVHTLVVTGTSLAGSRAAATAFSTWGRNAGSLRRSRGGAGMLRGSR
jgi:hypothetical protein